MSNFAGILKGLRIDNGYSQAYLARLLGISRSTVSSYENGSRQPDHQTLLKISQCLGVSLDHLLGNQDHLAAHPEYAAVLRELNHLLLATPIPEQQKTAILTEMQQYFRWRLEQARANLPSGERE